MPVFLISSRESLRDQAFDFCFSTSTTSAAPPSIPALPDLPERLEQSFEASLETWWRLGRELGSEPTGDLSHAAACSPNASEMGLMLAWSRLVEDCAQAKESTLVICDDPWLFRHLKSRPHVSAGHPPAIVWPTLKLALRGTAARLRRACILAWASIRRRGHRRRYPAGAPGLLVYGHPDSIPNGEDAYFGNLASEIPELQRVFHVDATISYCHRFAQDPKAYSLHSWGSPFGAIGLIMSKWRPSKAQRDGELGWLVRRQAAFEGGTAQGAMVRWQQICQQAWLRTARPGVVSWPWENHAWERALVRSARRQNVRTLGYQHTVVGRHAANHAPASNPDGLKSLPDLILCNGNAGRGQLTDWGVPAKRLKIAGAFRLRPPDPSRYDPDGPVFVALPMKHAPAREMIEAVQHVEGENLTFLLKVHPMTDLAFADSARVQRTTRPLGDHDGLRGVLYSASTVGLEALMAGLPTLRFLPRSTIAIDILTPPAYAIPATSDTLTQCLKGLAKPAPILFEEFFTAIDSEIWRTSITAADL